jgi:predicted dehydrogenase
VEATVERIGIGMVGHGFMGKAHSQAWRTVAHAFELPLRPELVALAGRDPGRAREAADRLGWADVEPDWRALVGRPDVDLVDICTPGAGHAPIALAALAAGKHVLCEKPLANTLAEAEEMVAAADRARDNGVRAMTGFNYRRVPALALAGRLVAEGRLGPVRHVRARYLQDWLTDPAAPSSWRLDASLAGSGALGDLGAHLVDLVGFLLPEHPIESVVATMATFTPERPAPGGGTAPVTVDDAAAWLARCGPVLATFGVTRCATGRRNGLQLEIDGERGSIGFDLERLNELALYETGMVPQGFRLVLVTEPDDPYISAWWPPGHTLGWEHTFIHQAADLLTAIAESRDPAPSFADGLSVQRVLDAVARSAATGAWVRCDGQDPERQRGGERRAPA